MANANIAGLLQTALSATADNTQNKKLQSKAGVDSGGIVTNTPKAVGTTYQDTGLTKEEFDKAMVEGVGRIGGAKFNIEKTKYDKAKADAKATVEMKKKNEATFSEQKQSQKKGNASKRTLLTDTLGMQTATTGKTLLGQ